MQPINDDCLSMSDKDDPEAFRLLVEMAESGGWTREGLSKAMGYSKNYLSRVLTKGAKPLGYKPNLATALWGALHGGPPEFVAGPDKEVSR